MIIDNIVNEYFDAFTKKNIGRLSELYHDDVSLNEWNSSIFEGKSAVIEANKKLFEQFEKIAIVVKTKGITANRSINEILVVLDGTSVNVVDVIEIVDNKIKNIVAYRGF
jgi:hypothetical protein